MADLKAKNQNLSQQISLLNRTADYVSGKKVPDKVVEAKSLVIYSDSFDGSKKIRKFGNSNKLNFAKFEKTALLIENKDPEEKHNLCGFWLNLPKSSKITFSVMVKAENVRGTDNIKFGLMIKDPQKTKWPAANIGKGTFDWHKVSFTIKRPSKSRCLFFYGLQNGTGKVWFKNLKITTEK